MLFKKLTKLSLISNTFLTLRFDERRLLLLLFAFSAKTFISASPARDANIFVRLHAERWFDDVGNSRVAARTRPASVVMNEKRFDAGRNATSSTSRFDVLLLFGWSSACRASDFSFIVITGCVSTRATANTNDFRHFLLLFLIFLSKKRERKGRKRKIWKKKKQKKEEINRTELSTETLEQ